MKGERGRVRRKEKKAFVDTQRVIKSAHPMYQSYRNSRIEFDSNQIS